MNNEIYQTAFNDEIEKIAKEKSRSYDAAKIMATATSIPVGIGVGGISGAATGALIGSSIHRHIAKRMNGKELGKRIINDIKVNKNLKRYFNDPIRTMSKKYKIGMLTSIGALKGLKPGLIAGGVAGAALAPYLVHKMHGKS